jgi:hypothetical protein
MKECKTVGGHNELQQLRWNEGEEQEDHIKDGVEIKHDTYNGNTNRLKMVADRRKWRRLLLESNVHNGLKCLRRTIIVKK